MAMPLYQHKEECGSVTSYWIDLRTARWWPLRGSQWRIDAYDAEAAHRRQKETRANPNRDGKSDGRAVRHLQRLAVWEADHAFSGDQVR